MEEIFKLPEMDGVLGLFIFVPSSISTLSECNDLTKCTLFDKMNISRARNRKLNEN